jgi:hypothetical protein
VNKRIEVVENGPRRTGCPPLTQTSNRPLGLLFGIAVALVMMMQSVMAIEPGHGGIESEIEELIGVVEALDVKKGIKNALVVKLHAALAALDVGDTATACGSVLDFMDLSSAQSGKHLSISTASELMAFAGGIA